MSKWIERDICGLYDPDTGEWVGMRDLNGREQLLGTSAPGPGTVGLAALAPDAVALSLDALASNPDALVVGAISRDANGAAISASVSWPDGATGAYTATTVSAAFPGAVDAYTVTHVLAGVTTTYTQPAVTRNADGAVVTRPAIVRS